jgi:hypothetical protein
MEADQVAAAKAAAAAQVKQQQRPAAPHVAARAAAAGRNQPRQPHGRLAVPSKVTEDVPKREMLKGAPQPQQERATVAAAEAAAVPSLPGALGLMLMRGTPGSPAGDRRQPPVGEVPVWLAGAASPPVLPPAAAAAVPAINAAARPGLAVPLGSPAAAVAAPAAAQGVEALAAAQGVAGTPVDGGGPLIQACSSSDTSSKQAVTQQAAAAAQLQSGQRSAAQQPEEDVEQGMCAVCWAARSRVLMLPCRHLCCCSGCWLMLQAKGSPCPMCRQEVKEHIEVYV